MFVFEPKETSKKFKLEILPDSEWELVKNFELIMKLMMDYSTTKESPEIKVGQTSTPIPIFPILPAEFQWF